MNFSRTAIVVCILFAVQSHAQEPIDEIEVVGQTPLGAGVDADMVASNVQIATAETLREQRALDLADFMSRNLAGVFVNEAQSSPLQPDVQYRGFVCSPLLGLPQGIAVYQDGVRVNEPFGDTVNWAVLPNFAIDTVYLMPGSNPLFGLNALGGAIAIETKSGFSSPGSSAEIYAGSFGRRSLSIETGGSDDDRLGYYLSGSYLEEDGWRDFSPTRALQLFGDIGWQTSTTSIDLAMTLADTDLIGNGPAPIDLLNSDRKAIFTRPDQTENELRLISLTAEHDFSDTVALTGNMYARHSDIRTYNGDDSNFAECAGALGFICEQDGNDQELIFDTEGSPIVAANELIGATVNRSITRQDGIGFGSQAVWTHSFQGFKNLFMAGIAYDTSGINFGASTELGTLDDTRRAIPGGIFVGESFIGLAADTSNLGFYLSNTFSFSDRLALTLSGRYNDAAIKLRDQLGTDLNGDHDFSRFNPAIGITTALSERLTLYAGYTESSRAPSPVELTCADENDPCRLPNAFLADPPLKQVVAKTIEFGVRGRWNSGSWHAGLFEATNNDDILFISAGALTNEGFFSNVGQTRRRGVEMSLNGNTETVNWFANYTYLDATFREALVLPSPNSPAAIDGEVTVSPGDRMPLIPNSLFKSGLQISVGSKLRVGGEILVASDFYMRGDEGNDLSRIGDHAVLNLRGEFLVNENFRLLLSIDNVFDEKYETFGLFGEADEVLGNGFEDRRFVSPAAPLGAWLGVRIEF